MRAQQESLGSPRSSRRTGQAKSVNRKCASFRVPPATSSPDRSTSSLRGELPCFTVSSYETLSFKMGPPMARASRGYSPTSPTPAPASSAAAPLVTACCGTAPDDATAVPVFSLTSDAAAPKANASGRLPDAAPPDLPPASASAATRCAAAKAFFSTETLSFKMGPPMARASRGYSPTESTSSSQSPTAAASSCTACTALPAPPPTTRPFASFV